MKAMILAAGRGERMRPLTDRTPKPLLQIGQHRLIEYHLINLANAGFQDIVINVSWLGQQIIETLGNGEHYDVNITYSDEGATALETGGGIFNALPLLGEQPFLVVNGDVWTDYPFKNLLDFRLPGLAHLVLVNNPEHNSDGDFYLHDRIVDESGDRKYTYSGIGIYQQAFFSEEQGGAFPLAPIIRRHIKQQLISAEYYEGEWNDIGNIERLEQIRKRQA